MQSPDWNIVGHNTRVFGKSPTYRSWDSMKQRCNNKNVDQWDDYGGRGINYTQEWARFENFLSDMGERPEGTSLDRINNDLGYSKENCRWATKKQQQNNQKMQCNNTSGVKGVYWLKREQRWQAQHHCDYKVTVLYYGPSYKDACDARWEWEKKNGY